MNKFKRRSVIALIAVASVMALLILHISLNVNPIIEQVSEKEVKALAEIAINSACDDVINEYYSVDMVNYLVDSDGNLQMVTTNSALMNLISRKATEMSQRNIETLGKQGVPIPLGSLSGITFLSGQGPDVYIKVFPVGSVNADFCSEFVSAGINQTKHKIILKIAADVKVVMPGTNNTVKTETQILMCENLIVGKVPDVYFDNHNLSDLLNLVP